MKIPNSLISASSDNNASFVHIEPAYYAPFYRRVWGRRIEDGNLKVEPLPVNAHQDVRYHDIDSVEAEARRLRSRFGAEYFDSVFPGGETELRDAIEREIRKDIARLQKLKVVSAIPHESYIKFGLSTLECPSDPALIDTEMVRSSKVEAKLRYDIDNTKLALALQAAGFPTRESCVGVDIMKLCEAGVSPDVAMRLSEATAPVVTTPAEVTDDALATVDAR